MSTNRLRGFGAVEPQEIIDENKYYNFSEAARIINVKSLGRNKLLNLMRENNLLDDYNSPTEFSTNQNYIKEGNDYYRTPLISMKGIKYVKKKILNI
jgi:hypothetical protein